MAKYEIQARTIAAVIWIVKDGVIFADAVYVGPDEIEYFVTNGDTLPIEVRNAVKAHFDGMYQKGQEWVNANFETQFKKKVVATVEAP